MKENYCKLFLRTFFIVLTRNVFYLRGQMSKIKLMDLPGGGRLYLIFDERHKSRVYGLSE